MIYCSHDGDNTFNSTDPFQVHRQKNKFRVIRVREMSGKFKFFQGQELSGNSVMCQGKMVFCKNFREVSGSFTYQPDEAGMFGPDVFFLLNS